ncbi:hypothetical protein [Mycolicibacterium sphagni]|uniref:Uncharacterized protein n=1 Tax=Mycolicibacterium sphagni TaxID=1786 RepID=A0A255DQJ3_9MYCO|nr:hypothetical protein [Mycolicibacterium sphagni]OYN81709.1 hypothetical protein CG716_04960 [Mycolicibacterium sphagni]
MGVFKNKRALPAPVAPKSVASITAGLNDTLAELEAHAEDQTTQAERQKRWADNALRAAAEHEAEVIQARKIAGNIKALLS